MRFKAALDFTLDVVFPKKCLLCGKEGAHLCSRCLSSLPEIKKEDCHLCHKKCLGSLSLCIACKKESALSGLVSAFDFELPAVKRLIHAAKYQYILDIIPPLAEKLSEKLRNFQGNRNWITIPVPLHKRKLRRRGFNQSELIAKEIYGRLNAPLYLNILVRKKNNTPQVSFSSFADRTKNVREIFQIKDEIDLSGKEILLIDDVSTTLSTLSEAARTLKAAGARTIHGATLAR